TEKAWRETAEAGIARRVTFSSFNANALEWLKKNAPEARTALLYHRQWTTLSDLLGSRTYSTLNLRSRYLTEAKIATIREKNLVVNVYTVNSLWGLRKFVRWGVDGIITNHPDRLMRILKRR
ncbi:MAG TPA: glycerophosphodiester phosphodiesterase, partial [Thermodesulfobacteriota bacterium]|nr:glycerophosphodiester phosphodiesterase [Thermodesulfobacteriota bacterium]